MVDAIMTYSKEFYCLLIFIDAAYEKYDKIPKKKLLCKNILDKILEDNKLTDLQIGQFLQVLLFTSRQYIYGGKVWYVYTQDKEGGSLVRTDAEASDAILMKYYENMTDIIEHDGKIKKSEFE